MELYGERGFEQTTVAEIAERAGLTERTFFRHFADKREVLFGGSDAVRDALVEAVAGAPEPASPLAAVGAGLMAFAEVLETERGRTFARRRQRIISSNDELRERELIKLATWATALADALRRRGVDEAAARLAAEVGWRSSKPPSSAGSRRPAARSCRSSCRRRSMGSARSLPQDRHVLRRLPADHVPIVQGHGRVAV